jgi:cupin 2 domain-containing protein
MSKMVSGNIFSAIDRDAADEIVTSLLDRPGLRLERIVSTGQTSPPGFWYDQPTDEWVLLIAGAARLEIDGENERTLSPGDYLLIPAHCRHRVAWTDPDQPTVWLAAHLGTADTNG